MRIALVSETYPPEVNGVALTVQALARGLAAQGHAIEIVRPRQPADPGAESGISSLLTRGAALPRYPGLRFGLPEGHRLTARWREWRPDAVYVATEGPLGRSALRTARRLGLPACTGFHTRFDDFVRHYGLGLLTPLVFAWLRRFHGRAAATLVPTRELVEFLTARGFRHVRILRRAVDTSLFTPARHDPALRAAWGLAADDVAVVHVGRVAAEKNLALLTRAFRAIQRECPTARCVIVGDGPARAALESANPDFVFAGMRHGEDLARHYASGDLFLFPSLTETFGNVTLEAMASGLATVAFDYGAAREHIAHGLDGLRVTRGDEAEFLAAASLFARDAQRRRAAGRLAREAVQALSPDAVIAAFVEILRSLTVDTVDEHCGSLESPRGI